MVHLTLVLHKAWLYTSPVSLMSENMNLWIAPKRTLEQILLILFHKIFNRKEYTDSRSHLTDLLLKVQTNNWACLFFSIYYMVNCCVCI